MLYQSLPYREVKLYAPYQYRVLFLDPAEIYTRIQVQPYARHQRPEHIGLKVMFPKRDDRTCSCGCGHTLGPRRHRWASDDCAAFAADIYAIIYGQRDTIRFYLKHYSGYRCQCGRVRRMKVDHIIPVKHGGGGCWLSNYQFLCHACHVAKTNTDFGWKGNKAL
ncbi:MAG: HNH endonuclease [Bacteroidetes bacterium]|nr:HNH endonuclease [Bacteroidota bacterium]